MGAPIVTNGGPYDAWSAWERFDNAPPQPTGDVATGRSVIALNQPTGQVIRFQAIGTLWNFGTDAPVGGVYECDITYLVWHFGLLTNQGSRTLENKVGILANPRCRLLLDSPPDGRFGVYVQRNSALDYYKWRYRWRFENPGTDAA